jgi:hypothetical protein
MVCWPSSPASGCPGTLALDYEPVEQHLSPVLPTGADPPVRVLRRHVGFVVGRLPFRPPKPRPPEP